MGDERLPIRSAYPCVRRVYKALNDMGWTDQFLAETANVEVGTVRNIRAGRNTPNLGTLTDIAEALGLEITVRKIRRKGGVASSAGSAESTATRSA